MYSLHHTTKFYMIWSPPASSFPIPFCFTLKKPDLPVYFCFLNTCSRTLVFVCVVPPAQYDWFSDIYMDGHSLESWVVSWVVSYQIPCYQRCIASGLLREINTSCNDKENSKFQWLSYMYYIITILLLYIVLCYIILYHVISGHIISHYS